MMYLRFVEVKPSNLPEMGAIRGEKQIKDMDGEIHDCYIISFADKVMGVRVSAFDKETGEYLGEQGFY